jgi:hypothetical protein
LKGVPGFLFFLIKFKRQEEKRSCFSAGAVDPHAQKSSRFSFIFATLLQVLLAAS